MTRARRGRSLVVWAAAWLLAAPSVGSAQNQEAFVDPLLEPELLDPLFPCVGEVAIFDSLKYGSFDYCRQHLRWVPGSFDCLRIIVPTCNVFPLGQPGLVFRSEEDRVRAGHAERIVCPEGPPPPTCPGSFPAGPIPRP